MGRRTTRLRVLVVWLMTVGVTAACGSAATPPDGGGSSGGGSSIAKPIRVVASTDVWGDIAARIGGRRVEVTSIIDSPGADPHSFQANAVDQLAVSRARIVLENGGGYDDFMAALLKAGPAPSVAIIDAVGLSGYHAVNGGLNEHVWYDFPAVTRVVTALVADLSAADPADASEFVANGRTFTGQLSDLEAREAEIRSRSGGAGIVVTEPVPLYMTAACGLVDRTPPAFSQSIEEGTDVPPRILAQTLDLVRHKQVVLLAYNEQTTGTQTQELLALARSTGVAVVPVTETLPAGQDYLMWMTANLAAIQRAVSP